MAKDRKELALKHNIYLDKNQVEEEDIQIKTWEQLQQTKEDIKNLTTAQDMAEYTIAGYLYRIWRDQAWKLEGYETFEEWIKDNQEFLKGRQTKSVYRLIRVWKKLVVEHNIPLVDLKDLGISYSNLIAKNSANEEQSKEMVSVAKGSKSVRDFQGIIKETDWDNPTELEIKDCQHKTVRVLFKCPDCSHFFYTLPDGTKKIVDKGNVINKDKIDDDIDITG